MKQNPILTDARTPPFLRSIWQGLRARYRGTIWENCQRYQLIGSGYRSLYETYPEQDGHFDIATARHLVGPLSALLDPAVRRVFVIGAIQVLKSIIGDIWIPYLMEHAPRPMLVLFEDDPKAKLFCSARLMDTLTHHPVLGPMIAGIDRNDATRTRIKLPNANLQVCGLNEGNVATLSWPNIWISEAWLHKNDGLLVKGIKRADRFAQTCKILIESQPGLVGEDLERECSKAHRVDLSWACPFCGERQTWVTPNVFGRLRGEDFVPVRPRHEAADWQPPTPGTFSGMKYAAATDGSGTPLTLLERAATAAWECHWCGTLIHDTPANRRAIMDSYTQDYQITLDNGQRYSPQAVAFFLPYESALDNRFSKTTANYLSANEAKRLGDSVPLRDWYLQERAVFYAEELTRTTAPLIFATQPAQADAIPDELCRVLAADAQQDDALTAARGKPTTGHFWVVVRALDKYGNQYQLWRGYVTSFDELVRVQDRFHVSNENVGIDASFYTHDLVEAAARHFRIYKRNVRKHGRVREQEVLHTWTLLKGDDADGWKHPDGRFLAYSTNRAESSIGLVRGQYISIPVPVFYWSNLRIKDQLAALRSGGDGLPKFTVLPRAQLDEPVRLKEIGELTYENQMNAEYKGLHPKKNRPFWDKYKGRRHNHYWDAECMAQVLFGIGNFIGLASPQETAVNAVEEA